MRRVAALGLLPAWILVFAMSTACVSWVDRLMTSWMGYKVSDLIASWGPPQEIIDAGDDGKIYIWAEVKTFTSTMSTTSSRRPSGGTTTTYTPSSTSWYRATRSFWVGKDGRVYRTAWYGKENPQCAKPAPALAK